MTAGTGSTMLTHLHFTVQLWNDVKKWEKWNSHYELLTFVSLCPEGEGPSLRQDQQREEIETHRKTYPTSTERAGREPSPLYECVRVDVCVLGRAPLLLLLLLTTSQETLPLSSSQHPPLHSPVSVLRSRQEGYQSPRRFRLSLHCAVSSSRLPVATHSQALHTDAPRPVLSLPDAPAPPSASTWPSGRRLCCPGGTESSSASPSPKHTHTHARLSGLERSSFVFRICRDGIPQEETLLPGSILLIGQRLRAFSPSLWVSAGSLCRNRLSGSSSHTQYTQSIMSHQTHTRDLPNVSRCRQTRAEARGPDKRNGPWEGRVERQTDSVIELFILYSFCTIPI